MKVPCAIYSLNREGLEIGQKLAQNLDADIYAPKILAQLYSVRGFDRIIQLIARTFFAYQAHIFITAAGIAVRAIAPHLQDKALDPAVLVLDQRGKFCASLLSGHIGRANELTLQVAELLKAEPVITTATDIRGIKAIDSLAVQKNLKIKNLSAIKTINQALLNQEILQLFDPLDCLELQSFPLSEYRVQTVQDLTQWKFELKGILVTWQDLGQLVDNKTLVLNPKCLIAGMGCNKHTQTKEVLELIYETFANYSLSLDSLACLCSSKVKQDESGLLRASQKLQIPFYCLEHNRLKEVQVPNPSLQVHKHMGVFSICEAAAMLQAGSKNLLVPKTKSKNATLAVALGNCI